MQRQTAAQRVPIAIDDFGDPVHGGEQQNIRLADNGADNVRLLIEKFHVDDGIERKVQPVGKMPGAIDAHHRDRFRQQGKIDSLSALKNSMQGEVLLTATGPSTRNIDFSLLSKTIPVMGVNGAWHLADRLHFSLYTYRVKSAAGRQDARRH